MGRIRDALVLRCLAQFVRFEMLLLVHSFVQLYRIHWRLGGSSVSVIRLCSWIFDKCDLMQRNRLMLICSMLCNLLLQFVDELVQCLDDPFEDGEKDEAENGVKAKRMMVRAGKISGSKFVQFCFCITG